jgi:hypothetical protein
LIHITDFLTKRGHEVQTYTSIKEQNVDLLQDILNELKEEAQKKRQEESSKDCSCQEKQKSKIDLFEDVEEVKERKERPPKKIAPEIFFILDDLGTQLRYPSVAQLLKTHRHYKSTCILSSQYIHDLSIESRKQLDYFIAFGGHSQDKLDIIYKDLDLSQVSFEKFLQIYHDATSKPFSFLFVDVRNEIFRKNLNQKYIL